jgi:hypothetical protein
MRFRCQPRREFSLALPTAVVLALLVATVSGRVVYGQADAYPLTIGVATCEAAPQRAGMLGPDCAASPDIALAVWSGPREDAGSRNLGTCVTRAAASGDQATCDVSVPFDTPLYIFYADESAIPAGYMPLSYPVFVPMTSAGVAPYPAPVFIINVPAAQAAPAAAPPDQPSSELAITVQSFTCAPGVTAATVPAGCVPAADGFSVAVASLAGVTEPASLADATRVGDAYVLGDAALRSRGLFGRLAIVVDGLPLGYSDYVVTGDAVTYDAALGQYVLDLPLAAPQATVTVYALPAPEATPGTAALTAAPEREIAIRGGRCDAPGAETAMTALADLTPPRAELGNEPDAPGLEVWRATVPLTLSSLQADPHAIEIRPATSGEGGAAVAPLVCGDVESGTTLPGAVTIALHGVGDSAVSGIAYLSPSAGDPSATDVVVFLATRGDGTPGSG